MRIAIICTEKLPVPAVDGGAVQLYIEGILPYLSKYHDITVFTVSHPKLLDEETIDGVKYIRITISARGDYTKKIKSYLPGNFDLVYVFNRPRWILSLSKGLDNVKFGLSLHNEMFRAEKITDEDAMQCAKRVSFIATVSKFIANGVKARVPESENKLSVVYSGADIDRYMPAWTEEAISNRIELKQKYGIENYRVVLYVGRLSTKKGVDVLLKAMKKVMDDHTDVALVVIGSKWFGKNEIDEYTSSLYELSKELKGPIVFTGFLPPNEIINHYNIGDVFVCSSQWNEPLARVHYEAMAAGLPILTTNRGGNAEVIERNKNGIVIDDIDESKNCSNPDTMAEYISYILANPSIAEEMGRYGRKLAEETFNWPRVSKDVLNTISKYVKISAETNDEPIPALEEAEANDGPIPALEEANIDARNTDISPDNEISFNFDF